MRSVLMLTLALTVTGILGGCTTQNPVAVDDPTVTGSIHVLTLPYPQLAATSGKTISSGLSPYLFVGQADHKMVSSLLQFSGFPDSGVVLQSATLTLTISNFYGDSTGSFTATVHRVNQEWGADSVTFASFAAAFDAAPMAQATITPIDSGTVTFDLEVNPVENWINKADTCLGFYLQPQSANFLMRFQGVLLTTPPQLQLYYTRDGTADSTTMYGVSNAFLIDVLQTPADGPLYVGDGVDYRTLLRYDLSQIPTNATINRVDLNVTLDSTQSFLPDDGILFDIYNVADSSTDDPHAENLETAQTVNSTTITVTPDTKTLAIGIGTVVQYWTVNQDKNFGMVLRPRTPTYDVFRAAFYSTATDSAKAPSLKIYYTLPPALQ